MHAQLLPLPLTPGRWPIRTPPGGRDNVAETRLTWLHRPARGRALNSVTVPVGIALKGVWAPVPLRRGHTSKPFRVEPVICRQQRELMFCKSLLSRTFESDIPRYARK